MEHESVSLPTYWRQVGLKQEAANEASQEVFVDHAHQQLHQYHAQALVMLQWLLAIWTNSIENRPSFPGNKHNKSQWLQGNFHLRGKIGVKLSFLHKGTLSHADIMQSCNDRQFPPNIQVSCNVSSVSSNWDLCFTFDIIVQFAILWYIEPYHDVTQEYNQIFTLNQLF